jgi:hypothetical protein
MQCRCLSIIYGLRCVVPASALNGCTACKLLPSLALAAGCARPIVGMPGLSNREVSRLCNRLQFDSDPESGVVAVERALREVDDVLHTRPRPPGLARSPQLDTFSPASAALPLANRTQQRAVCVALRCRPPEQAWAHGALPLRSLGPSAHGTAHA